MVSFRLSEEEYESLKHTCVAAGARSLSDVARDAVQRMLDNGAEPKKDLEREVRLLSHRMDELDHELKRLAQLVNPRASDHMNAELAT
ncbi:MAG TPA: hypothetical protein VLX58_10545 [Bryobacteraceae bacterium]|nr:hypothetical protein [Bryobacteraceae bacterium]